MLATLIVIATIASLVYMSVVVAATNNNRVA